MIENDTEEVQIREVLEENMATEEEDVLSLSLNNK